MDLLPPFEPAAFRSRARRLVPPTPALYQVLLRRLRLQQGLRQQQLARRIGKPQSFVSKYENGERRLDVSELGMVCRAMGMSLQAFVRALERSMRDGVPTLESEDPPDAGTVV